MIRAGVFVGVDQTGGLQRLHDAGNGARRMYAWAIAQGMEPDKTAILITDEGGTKPVTPDRIYQAISTLLRDSAGVDQLIVYFAGHGVNINQNEYWLLTEAPENTSAAVNVRGSVDLARYCGCGYVVFISDACRVAAEGIQAQGVRGADIFPNSAASERAKPVDQFFACLLGRPAAEIKDRRIAANGFQALYTNELLAVLNGYRPEVLEPGPDAAIDARFLWPARLEHHLESTLPTLVAKAGLAGTVNQNPDAILTVHPHWISRVTGCQVPGEQHTIRSYHTPESTQEPRRKAATLRSIASGLLAAALQDDPQHWSIELLRAKTTPLVGADLIADGVERLKQPFDPGHADVSYGVMLRGRSVVDAYSSFGSIRALGDNVLRVDGVKDPAVSVLVCLDDGRGAIVPAIRGYLAVLTFVDDELIDIAYEPSSADPRLRTLRAVIATASRHGSFHVDAATTDRIAATIRRAGWIDPTLALYLAYAYYDLQEIDRIVATSEHVRRDLGIELFDLSLLSRGLTNRDVVARASVFPCTPLLSQSWALLNAHDVKLPAVLKGIDATVQASFWSLYDARGVTLLRAALASGELS